MEIRLASGQIVPGLIDFNDPLSSLPPRGPQVPIKL